MLCRGASQSSMMPYIRNTFIDRASRFSSTFFFSILLFFSFYINSLLSFPLILKSRRKLNNIFSTALVICNITEIIPRRESSYFISSSEYCYILNFFLKFYAKSSFFILRLKVYSIL